MTEELWNTVLNHEGTIAYEEWPKYDEEKLVDKEVTIGVQVNCKLRATINISVDESEESIKEKALSEENVKRYTTDHEIVKIIVIKGKIVNIVVK
jgi:leucyl-tRNA synthetase